MPAAVYSSDGFALCTLCVIDTKPRTLSEQQKALLKDFAKLAEEEINKAAVSRSAVLRIRAWQESEAKLNATFEQAAVATPMSVWTAHGCAPTRSCVKVFGYDPSELQTRTFQDITYPDDLGTDLGLVKELLDGARTSFSFEKRYLHRLGHIVWTRLTVSLVRKEDGRPDHFISIIENIQA